MPNFGFKHSEKTKRAIQQKALLRRRLRKEGKIYGLKLEYPVLGRSLDIAHLPTKTDIEVDGNYHNTNKQKRKDRKRDHFLAKHGWTVIRVRIEQVRDAMLYNISPLIKHLKRRKN